MKKAQITIEVIGLYGLSPVQHNPSCVWDKVACFLSFIQLTFSVLKLVFGDYSSDFC